MTSYSDIRKSIEARKEFCASLVHTLRKQAAESKTNAFIELFDDTLERDAAAADARIHSGEPRELEGMLIGVKDNILIKGRKCTAASLMLENHRAVSDATVLQRLREAGALIAGRMNMDEFAMGSSGETSSYGPTLNPSAPGHIPGGSSSGSAAAVAGGLVHAALGSDTGGSVRQPAACTGTVGIKPTYGRVSRSGLIAFASSFEQIGVIAGSVDVAARVLKSIAGHDVRDATSDERQVPDFPASLRKGVAGLRIGIQQEYPSEAIAMPQRLALSAAAAVLASQGSELQPISLPLPEYLYPVYAVLANAEAASNLSRYDGMRYGNASHENENFHEAVIRNRSAGFGREVKRRIMIGTHVLSSGYREQWFNRAAKLRRRIVDEYASLFEQVDVLLLPVIARPPAAAGELLSDPVAMYRSDIHTVAANLTGLPAISVPFGKDQQGLPVAVQLMAGAFREDLLFAAAAVLEGAVE